MAIEKYEYLSTAKERITQQFKGRPNLEKLLTILLEGSEEIQNVISDIDDIKYIDRASGAQLDNIGEIVGQPRVIVDADLIAFFGMQGLSTSRSYGDVDDPSKGGRWKSLGEVNKGNIRLSDNEYRIFIRAKILRNTTVATTEDIIKSIKFLFSASKVHLLEDTGVASYRVTIGKKLTQQERNLVKYSYQDGVKRSLLVKPAGVRIDTFSEFNPSQFFGFSGVVDAKGYGDIKEIAEYTPYFATYGMFGYGDLKDIAEVSIERNYYTYSRHTTRVITKEGGDNEIKIPFSGEAIEVYVDGAFTDSYISLPNLIHFNQSYPRGTAITVVERFGREVINSFYTFNDPNVTTLFRKQYESSYGDVNNPSEGSRYRGIGEGSDDNNILYTGPIKKIQYFDPEIVTLTEEGGYYSTVIN